MEQKIEKPFNAKIDNKEVEKHITSLMSYMCDRIGVMEHNIEYIYRLTKENKYRCADSIANVLRNLQSELLGLIESNGAVVALVNQHSVSKKENE